MGLLDVESPDTLDYFQSKPYQKKLKAAGLEQLLRLFKKFKNEKKDFKRYPKFGYELEGHMMKIIKKEDGAIDYQLELDNNYIKKQNNTTFKVVDEYGRWMAEVIPKVPMDDFLYSGNLKKSIKNIFVFIREIVKPGQVYLSFPLPPKLGTPSYPNFFCPGLGHEELAKRNEISQSEYMVDEMINDHPRFPTLTRNVRQRRTEKPQITAGIFQDKNTNMETVLPGEKEPGRIHLDAFGFGMGMSSLQITFGVSNLAQARWLYDQYHVFTPIWVKFILCSLLCPRRRLSIKANYLTQTPDGNLFVNQWMIEIPVRGERVESLSPGTAR
jgi:glutamate--cysteine ligase catalytic subunit